MDYKTAINTLDLSEPFDERQLKKMYFKKSLKFHPDKNNNENHEKFIEINKAYNFLRNNKKYNNEIPNNNLTNIINSLYGILSENCASISIKLLEKLEKNKAIEIYNLIHKYQYLFSISDDILSNMEQVIREKIKDDNIIILNPTLDNIINSNIYILTLNDDTYYVPLWHKELVFEKNIIVKCIPDISNNIFIDDHNNIHYYDKHLIIDVFNNKKIEFMLGSVKHNILSKEICITKYQTIVLKNKGISKINNDIYYISTKSHIYFHLELM
tara:strand:+ start:7107 stop:7916 length:810 start_codon:yes stop_codon:yes gene_type:complete